MNADQIDFMQHQYTWSSHCINGNKLGWGISASTAPGLKTVLLELEKLAADAEPDRTDGQIVEELIYSPLLGFVRLFILPLASGEDGRSNKLVHMITTADPGEDRPAAYFAGNTELLSECFFVSEEKRLPGLTFPFCDQDPDDILNKMKMKDRISLLMRAVFRCLLESRGSLNFVAPKWDRNDFLFFPAGFMYAIHCMLPDNLRKKAGYCSFARKETENLSFCFSCQPCGDAVFYLDGEEGHEERRGSGMSDELADLFYEGLGTCWSTDRKLYEKIMDTFSAYLDQSPEKGRELNKLYWIYYDRYLKPEGKQVSGEYLAAALPDLMYWSDQEDIFQDISRKCVNDIHCAICAESPAKTADVSSGADSLMKVYMLSLLDKASGRSIEMICQELHWLLSLQNESDPCLAAGSLRMIREKNKTIYDKIRLLLTDEDGLKQILDEIERENRVKPVDEERNVRCVNVPPDEEHDTDIVAEDAADQSVQADYKLPEEADYKVLGQEDEDKSEEKAGPWSDFLLTTLPAGFLTGCVMFLSHYALMIGHWKITVGMCGMWLIFLLTYVFLIKTRQQNRPLWMGIGLSLLTGEIIEIAASYFIPVRIRLLYFTVLGVLAAGIQIFNIVKVWRKNQ